jgi:hypothetical protein
LKRHRVLIGMAVWLAAAVIVSGLGLTQKLKPPTPQLILGALTAILLVLSFVHSPLRSWVLEADWRALVEIHLIRAVAGAGFLWAGSRGRFPTQFARMAGQGDIAVAVLALLVILLVSPHRSFAPWIYGIWNTLGLLDILHVVADAARSASANPASMAQLLKSPFALLPLFVVPILIASHVWLYERIYRRVSAEEPA